MEVSFPVITVPSTSFGASSLTSWVVEKQLKSLTLCVETCWDVLRLLHRIVQALRQSQSHRRVHEELWKRQLVPDSSLTRPWGTALPLEQLARQVACRLPNITVIICHHWTVLKQLTLRKISFNHLRWLLGFFRVYSCPSWLWLSSHYFILLLLEWIWMIWKKQNCKIFLQLKFAESCDCCCFCGAVRTWLVGRHFYVSYTIYTFWSFCIM